MAKPCFVKNASTTLRSCSNSLSALACVSAVTPTSICHSALSALMGFSAKPFTVMLCWPATARLACTPKINAAEAMPMANSKPNTMMALEKLLFSVMDYPPISFTTSSSLQRFCSPACNKGFSDISPAAASSSPKIAA